MLRVFRGITILSVIFLTMTGCRSDKVVDGDTSVDIIPTEPDDPFFPGAFVCEAFQEADPVTDLYQGLVGEIFYLRDDQPRYESVLDYMDFAEIIDEVSLYFNTVNIPTRPFDRGFVTSNGEVLTTENGDTLYEYFGFRMHSDFMLDPDDSDGLYEFATLTDDGSLLYLNDTVIVNNDGKHPTKFGCGSEPVYLERGTRYPLRLEYYQGPRYHIAAILMYRPYDASRPVDPECGLSGNARYFDSTQDPPVPTANYQGILDRGWLELSTSNYKVPQGIMNMCNFPAPQVSGLALVEISSSHAKFSFDTDVPAVFSAVLTNLSTGAETSTKWSEEFFQKHQVEFQGLTSYTLYQIEILTESPSGRQTRTSPVSFRTRQ